MPIYQTNGSLTGTISQEDLAVAQAYLTDDDMTQYLDEPLKAKIERIQWQLAADGHDYVVEAFALLELTDAELKQLSDWVSGQNSDGLGEGFEQQPFAEVAADYDDDEESVGMISFDWVDNKSEFTRIR